MMEDLIDIQGLDYIGWWPLAIGWWGLIVLILIMLSISIIFLIRTYRYRKSWRYLAYKRLSRLQQQLATHEPKQIIQDLSIELRKIAMLSSQREACAGLTGIAWLNWLQEHDPRGFNWVQDGAILLNAQYMPNVINSEVTMLQQLIAAAQRWVKK